MRVLVQRMMHRLLILTLVLPTCSGHVCRCSSRPNVSGQSASAQSPLPERACCAKRLAAKTSSSQKPGVKSRCCCDEIRWSQSVAKITADAGPKALFADEPAFDDAAAVTQCQAAECFRAAELPVVRAGPGDSALVWNCRWQV